MIRWGRLAIIVTPFALIWMGTHFFLDRSLRRLIQSAGSAAVGAKVDVKSVHTSLWNLSATVKGLAITDPDRPMTNAVEVGIARLRVSPRPLFWKKFVVERAEISGIRTGTPRRSSGALPKTETPKGPKGSSALEMAVKKEAATALANVKGAYDPMVLFAPESLASYQKALAEKEKWSGLSERWKTSSENLKTEDLSRRIKDFSEKIKHEKISGVEGLGKIQSLLREGQDLNKDLSALRKEVKNQGATLMGDLAEARASLKEIDRLRQQDIDRIMSQAKGAFSVEGFTRNLLGADRLNHITHGLTWMRRLRELSSKKNEEESPPPPSRRGRDIAFPFHHPWPAFHLMSASIDGQTPGGLDYKGTLEDISSDAEIIRRPVRFSIHGAKGKEQLAIEGQVGWNPAWSIPAKSNLGADENRLHMEYTGFSLSNLSLGDVRGRAVTLAQGAGRGVLEVAFNTSDRSARGTAEIEAAGLTLAAAPTEKPDRLDTAIDRLLAGVRQAQVKIGISGTVDHPLLAVSSSLDDALKSALQNALGQEMNDQRTQLEGKINASLTQETGSLSALLDKNSGAALEHLHLKEKGLEGLETQIKEALDKLSHGNQGLKVPDLKGLFKKK